jgi:hypothetical protein
VSERETGKRSSRLGNWQLQQRWRSLTFILEIGLFIPGRARGLLVRSGFERTDLAHDLERGCAGAAG